MLTLRIRITFDCVTTAWIRRAECGEQRADAKAIFLLWNADFENWNHFFHKNNFNSRSNNKNWTNLISVWFYQLYVSADRLHTGTKTCTQTAEGKIIFLVIKMFGWSDCALVACQDKKKASLSCYLSHLKYLKAVDVQDAHDLVPSFSLCLQGHNIGTIRNKVQQWSFVSLNK